MRCFRSQSSNPKRERGRALPASLTLRVTFETIRVQYQRKNASKSEIQGRFHCVAESPDTVSRDTVPREQGASNLDQANASGAGPLVALADRVFNFLTLLELVKSCALDFLRVKKQILAVASNKSKTLVAHQLLDLAYGHNCLRRYEALNWDQ
jgi:hypothetical protein